MDALLLFVIAVSSGTSTESEQAVVEGEVLINEQDTQEIEVKTEEDEADTQEEIAIDNVEETEVESTQSQESMEVPDIHYEDVFLYDLINNTAGYKDKYIRTVFCVDQSFKSGDSENEGCLEYNDTSELIEDTKRIQAHVYNYENMDDEYVTVAGKAYYENDHTIEIQEAYVVDSGAMSKEVYDSNLTTYKENYIALLQEQRQEFIDSCIEVSYDELRRFPEKYRDTPIKLKIYIKQAEPDGWIFPGDIIALYQDQELGVYDNRLTREPRFLEGDTVTVYATGDGLSKINIKEQGTILKKTVDSYEIPAIEVQYTENDEASFNSIWDIDVKPSKYEEQGRRIANDISDKLESLDN